MASILQEEFGSHKKQLCIESDLLQDELGGKSIKVVKEAQLTTASSLFRSIFLPEGYPSSVTRDYFAYQCWDTLQALCSSVTGVLSTRAVLAGYGVGNAEATASAAAIQWVVKNGTGMIGRILFAWKYGTSLDYNAKMWRLVADILNDFGMALEIISPHFPELFLVLACTGTIAKSITGVAGGCSRAALTQHFAKRDNLDGSQETAVGLIGMILGSFVTAILAHEDAGGILTWTLFVVFTIFHLFCNYKGLTVIQLNTFNRQRANIFFEEYSRKEGILTPEELSRKEKIFWRDDSSIILGASVFDTADGSTSTLNCLLEQYKNDKYLLSEKDGIIRISLQKYATSQDILKAYLHALKLRQTLGDKQSQLKAFEFINKQFANIEAKANEVGWNLERCLLGPTEWRFSLESAKSKNV